MAAAIIPIDIHPRWVARVERAPHAVPTSTYRRRRIVAVVLLLGALLAIRWVLGALGGGPLTASEPVSPGAVHLTARPISREVYVVQPGDTLWRIARSLKPEGDVRPLVDQLARQLGGRALQAGTRLTLPPSINGG